MQKFNLLENLSKLASLLVLVLGRKKNKTSLLELVLVEKTKKTSLPELVLEFEKGTK